MAESLLPMPLFYALGDALIKRDELLEKVWGGKLNAFQRSKDVLPSEACVEFSNGALTSLNASPAPVLGTASEPIKPEPIGIGKPLTIEIREVYTGEYPRKFLRSSSDMLVTTPMKGIEVFNGSPRAINFLEKSVGQRRRFRNTDPTQPGTPLVFYSPALTSMNSVLKVEAAFDEFPGEVFSALATATQSAAGIPVFAPASAYLFAAGQLINLASKLGDLAFDNKPEFGETTEVSFDRPGDFAAVADFRLLMAENQFREIAKDYKVDAKGTLVRVADGTPYDGDYPYVVLCFDGRKRKNYEGFNSTAATADLLERFIGGKNQLSVQMDTALEGMKLYSDMRFRQQAQRVQEEILEEADPDRKAELIKQRDAAAKNILCADLKPKFGE
jgi:hypothetical protein